MADKIVQLINKDGDNIYPIASVPNGASITMTSVDPGEGTALAADNYIGVYGASPVIMDYSTVEVDTGTKWIDGSIIYKKTINFGTLPNATNKTVNHNISNLGRVIKSEGWAYSSGSSLFVMIPAVSVSAVANGISLGVTDTLVKVSSGSDQTAFTECYITLYYTKSS